ncbi:MAG TPA: MBL fold metallo-hydrolase [Candidatus Methanoperedens sp.]|nr:MBL fold metallo-hydrolase [Candidatus Methanoperedens sp.]
MEVTVWGARGSIPVSGPEYDRYGGDTTCLEVRGPAEPLLIDAGTGLRRAGNRLHAERARHIHLLFTHAHWDHVLGFPFFRPLFTRGVRIEVYGCLEAQTSVREMLGRAMSPPSFPVDLGDVSAELVFHEPCRGRFEAGGFTVSTLPLSHPNGGVGYALEEGGRRLVFLTDNELSQVHPGGRVAAEYRGFAAGADLLLHDGEFTAEEYRHTRGWGHSTWEEALDLALAAGVRRFGLWHHNMGRDDEALERIVGECRSRSRAAGADIEVFAATQGQHLTV